MNIDNGRIYPTVEAAREDGVSEDKLVSGTRKALEDLKARLFPKRRRARMRGRKRG